MNRVGIENNNEVLCGTPYMSDTYTIAIFWLSSSLANSIEESCTMRI